MTKLEIIQEVLVDTYAKNPSLRAIENDLCQYTTKDGRHCAIGMCMTAEMQNIEDGHANRNVIGLVGLYGDIDKVLLKKYHGHETSFWMGMQRFHDNSGNFNETGLSDLGKSALLDFQKVFI